MRTYTKVFGVIQKVSNTWWAGYAFEGFYGTKQFGHAVPIFSGACATHTAHESKESARQDAVALARGYRNTILTLGGCTFDTLPKLGRVQHWGNL